MRSFSLIWFQLHFLRFRHAFCVYQSQSHQVHVVNYPQLFSILLIILCVFNCLVLSLPFLLPLFIVQSYLILVIRVFMFLPKVFAFLKVFCIHPILTEWPDQPGSSRTFLLQWQSSYHMTPHHTRRICFFVAPFKLIPCPAIHAPVTKPGLVRFGPKPPLTLPNNWRLNK